MADPKYESKTLDKLQGRLRCIRRARTDVNAARAEFSGSIAVSKRVKERFTLQRQNFDPDRSHKPKARARKLRRGDLKDVSEDVWVNCFVTLSADASHFKHRCVSDRSERIATVTARLTDLEELARMPGPRYSGESAKLKGKKRRAKKARGDGDGDEDSPFVLAIDLADTMRLPLPALGAPAAAPAGRPQPDIYTNAWKQKHKNGENVLVGIIDVGGFDFAHPDFMTAGGESRFVRIWDQGGGLHAHPAGYNYGSEITKAHIDAAVAAQAGGGLPATLLEPQSQRMKSSHGTHVASIAAGNGGLCRNAKIAGVLISLPPEGQDRRLSFYDSTRVAHAVNYLMRVKEDVGADALVINISLGTNGGAHDASSPLSRWIDAAIAAPGNAVCVAAGNAGQEAPTETNELGFLMGRIHTSGTVPASELQRDLHWIVVGDGIEDISENELEIWYKAQDRFEVMIQTPDEKWIGPVAPGEFIENKMLTDRTFVSIYNELYDASNGDNRISIYLSPFMSEEGVAGVTPGRWTVRLIGTQIRDGSFHGWIERDDPTPLGTIDGRTYWRFPSFFAEGTNVDNSSVSSLACGPRVISVANLDEARYRINATSSQGPTRDGRFKPEIAAPGTDILAANGFEPDIPWVRMSGTSMASPYVAGVVGLMLALKPDLTAAQVGGIIQRTARPLPGHTYDWQNDAGYGQIDPLECLREVDKVSTMKRLNT